MGRIKIYNPSQKASSLTGVPPVDNSGGMLASAIAGSTNMLADTSNQIAYQQQSQALAASQRNLVMIGQRMRELQQIEAANDAKQQAYNDHGTAQFHSTNTTMDMRTLADKIQTENPNTPETWAQQFREQSESILNSSFGQMNQEAAKLATPSMFNARESNYARLVESGRDARTKLNETNANNVINRLVSNGTTAGSTQDFNVLASDINEIYKAATTLKITVPEVVVDSQMMPKLKQYTSNFINAGSQAVPGSVDQILKRPEIQGLLKLFEPDEIEKFRTFDKQRVDDYFTEETIEQRRQNVNNDAALYNQFYPATLIYTNPELAGPDKVQQLNQYLVKGRELSAKFDEQVTAGEWNTNPSSVQSAQRIRENMDKYLNKIQGYITTINSQEEAKKQRQATEKMADKVSETRVDLREDWNSKPAQALRQRLEYLWQSSRPREGMTRVERGKALENGERYRNELEAALEKNPNWLAEPQIDGQGNTKQGDLSYVGKRLGIMQQRTEQLQSQSSKSNPFTKLLGMAGIAQGSEVATKKPTDKFYQSVAAYSPQQRSAVDNALENQVHKMIDMRAAKNLDTSPEKANELRDWLMRPENRTWVPKGGPPLKQQPAAKPAKTKSGLVPPPPPDAPTILPEDYYDRAYGGRNIP